MNSAHKCLCSLAAVAVVLACAPGAGAAVYSDSGFEEKTMISGLTQPTAVAWAPNGRAFVAEKQGRLRTVAPGATTPGATPVIDISGNVNDFGDRGFLGLALDAAFATNGYVYLLYTYEVAPMSPDLGGQMTSRLTRIEVNPQTGARIGGETTLLGSYGSGPCPAPSNTLDCIPSDSSSHSIGTVRADPADGTLWVGSGDGSDFGGEDPRALRTYNEATPSGKVLHVDRNGKGLVEHPFCHADTDRDHVCTKVHSKGFRNPFRFQVRPGGGLSLGDVGWGVKEELNLLPAAGGKSYGWPCYEGAAPTGGYNAFDECQAEYAKPAGTHTPPDHEYPHAGESAAIVGGPEYTASGYPGEYRGSIFFGDYGKGFIKRAKLNSAGKVTSVEDFATGWYGVDLTLGPNGDLATVSFGDGDAGTGSVERISYTSSNRTPHAVAGATPTSGSAPLTVAFDGSGSSDPDNDPLSYDWDFGDGTAHSTARSPSHAYTDPDTYTATLTVTDGRFGGDSHSVRIDAGNDPPVPRIDAPASGFLYRDGEQVNVSGSATDPQEGTLTGTRLSWRITLHHGTHTHPLTDLSGAAASFTPLKDHDADSYYDIELTATDAQGLAEKVTTEVHPQTVALSLQSSPTGAPMTYAGLGVTAPHARPSAVGFRTSVSAAERFVSAGRTWRFTGWSDGPTARSRPVTVPATAIGFTASYAAVSPPTGPAPAAPKKPPVEEKPPAAPKPRGPALVFKSRTGLIRGRTALRGTAQDADGVAKVQVALMRGSKGGGCRWWSKRAGRLARHGRSCERRAWMRARLGPVTGKRRWRVKLGGRLRPGTYRVLFRATDGDATVSHTVNGDLEALRLKVRRPRRG